MAKRAVEASLWDIHKDTIHDLYMAREMPLKEVMEILDTQHGFKRTKAQYERNFNRWAWRRKLKADEWKAIGQQVQKRKADGKPDSDLQIQGIHMPRDKIQRGVTRHQFKTTLEFIQQGVQSNQSGKNSVVVRISSPARDMTEFNLRGRLDEALKKLPWMAFQKLIERQVHNTRCRASSENALLILDPSPAPEYSTEDVSLEIGLNGDSGTAGFPRWAEALTFDLFLKDSKQRLRLIDLAGENALSFLPRFNGQNPSLLPEVGLIGDMNSQVTQLQFLQLAVALLSNNRTDGAIEHVLAELCLIPRNLAFIRRFLDQKLLSTRCFADQLLLPAVERQQTPLIRALLKAGANPLTIRWRKDFRLSQLTLAAHITLGIDRSGKVGGTFRHNEEDSALSLAVQLHNEATVRALLDNLGNAPIYEGKKSSAYGAGSRLGFELAILKAVDCNRAPLLRLILEAGYVKKMLMPVIATTMPKMLEYAVATKRFESISVLLACFGTSISVDQKALNMALSSAARGGHVMLAEQLMDLGADVNPSPGLGHAINEEIPLGRAVQGAHIEMVRLLLEKGADPNLSSVHCARPLQIAAQLDAIEISEILLEAGADPNSEATLDTYDMSASKSAIKWALLHSAAELFFLLVGHGANVQEPMAAHDTHSVLTLALMSERIDTIEFLLNQNVWPSKDQRDRSFQACIHFYDFELVQRFVNHNVELNDTGALCAAISKNKLHIVEYLLEQVQTIYGQLPPGYGAAGLALATQLAMPHLVRLFLYHNIQPFDDVLMDVYRVAKYESRDWHGERKYLQKGTCALVEATRCDSQQPRELQMECLDLLLEHCQQSISEHAELTKFQTAIDFALWCVSHHKNLEIAKLLVREGANCFAESSPPPFHTSPLASAAEGSTSCDLLEWYLEYGVEDAAHAGQRQQAIDNALVTCVTKLNSMRALKLLLKNGANVNFDNCQALRIVIPKNNLPVIEVLLKAGPDVSNIRESGCGATYMQNAVSTGNPELVKLLLRAGADHYNTSLAVQEAAELNDTKIVKMLLDHGADVNIQRRLAVSNKTSLQHAARNGNFEIVKMLLEAGGDINAPRGRLCGRTALEGAAEQGFLDMVRFLLEMGADVQGRDNKVYRRSVYRAWSEGNITVAEMIQDFKRARYGLDDCVSIEEIVETMDPFGLEIEPYGEESAEVVLVS